MNTEILLKVKEHILTEPALFSIHVIQAGRNEHE